MRDEVYDQYARQLTGHWWTASRRDLARTLLGSEGVHPDGSHRVLEIGSGSGNEHAFLDAYGPVTGVEVSEHGLRHCRERAYAALWPTDLNTFEPPVSTFDLIADFHVLYHAMVIDPVDVLRRLRVAATAGATLIVTEPAFEQLRRGHDEAVMTARRWSRQELRRDLEAGGFEVVKLTGFMSPLLPGVIARLVWEALRRDPPAHTVAELEPPSAWLDMLLRRVLGVERAVVSRVSVPLGVCWAAVARAR